MTQFTFTREMLEGLLNNNPTSQQLLFEYKGNNGSPQLTATTLESETGKTPSAKVSGCPYPPGCK